MSGTFIGSSGVTFPDSSVQATAATGFGFKNRIINGSMGIWQRGTTGTSGYTSVDRWYGGTTNTFNQSSDVPAGFKYSLSFSITSAAYVTMFQNIESVNVTDLVGNNVTISFWAKNSSGTSNLAVELLYANTTDTFSSVTSISINTVSASPSSSWTQYSTTFTSLPSGVANGLQIRISRQNGASASTTLVTGVQLEKGSTATSFDYRPYGTELALCQRYYYRAGSIALNIGSITGPGAARGWMIFPVEMRSTPSGSTNITGYGNGANQAALYINGYAVCTSFSILVDILNTESMSWVVSSVANTIGQSGSWDFGSGSYVAASAELV